jgi:hypothetical protein
MICIPKLVLEIQDLSLPATVLSPRLDDKDIVGHQGLSRFVHDFPQFHKAIEEYMQRDHLFKLNDGTMTIVPGINFLP